MSYEGHEQLLCRRGHYSERDCRDDGYVSCDSLVDGKECGADFVFVNAVDDTNCDSYGIIPPEQMRKLLVTEAVVETCSHCSAQKLVSDAIYRIPTAEEAEKMRCWQPKYGGTPYEPLSRPAFRKVRVTP